jgi:hypothetical protein
MVAYTYLAADLRTNAILGDLPLTGVSFGRALNGAGTFAGTLKLSDSNVQKIGPIACTEPGRVSVYVDRGGVLQWGGIIWTRKYNPADQTLTLGGNEFWSYFDRRYIRAAVNLSEDQLAIAQSVINTAQSANGGNIGVTVGTETSPITKSLLAYSYELRKVSTTVEDMAKTVDGFDFRIDVAYDSNGVPQKYLRLGYPRLGATGSASGLVFEFPGSITDYEWSDDATKMSNALYVTGAGSGETSLQAPIQAPDMIDAGYPLLEDTYSLKNVTDQGQLNERAQALSAARKGLVTIPSITVRTDVEPKLGSYSPGDDATVTITDSRFPTGMSMVQRITDYTVTPNDGTTPESVKITMDTPSA